MSLQQINADNLTQLEYYHERLDFTQRYSQLLKFNISKLSHKTSKVRDSGDETAHGLLDFSVRDILLLKETNRLFNLNLKQFAYCLLAVEDQRDSNIECINSKVLNDLSQFIETIKYAKTNDFRSLLEAYNKDQPKKKSLINLLNPMSNSKPSKSCGSINKSVFHEEMSLEKSKSLYEVITKEIESFEKNKISSMQNILKKYTLSQINFHNQALQLYTTAYKCLVNKDLAHNVKAEISQINQRYLNSVNVDDAKNLENLIEELNKEINHRPLTFKRNEIFPGRRESTKPLLGRDSTVSNSSISLFRASLAADSLLAVAPASERFVPSKFNGIKRSGSAVAKLSSHSIKSVNSNKIDEDCETSKITTPQIETETSLSIKNITCNKECSGKDQRLSWFNETSL